MKKLLAILMLTLSTLTMSAQTEATETAEEGKYPVYCDLMAYNFWGIGRLKVKLDMGRTTYGYEYIMADNGKKMKFDSTMGAINYMAKRGWRVKTTYYISNGVENVLHYLLYKMVKDDKEIYDGLKTMEE